MDAQQLLEQELFKQEQFVQVSLVVHRPVWAPDPEAEQAEKERAERIKKRRGKKSKKSEKEDDTKPPSPLKEKIDVDIANILRGGYPKAKFNAEPADTGNIALDNTLHHEQDFSVVHLKIPEQFVRSITHETEWTVLSGKHGARAKMVEMAKLLRKKDRELEELEELLNSATSSIQAFHLQQKELFDEFVALRSNYDDCKGKLRESVWVHSCKMSREFSVIPPLLRNAVEDNSTIEQYLLGGVIGTGESSKVRSCKLGMSGGSRKGGGGGGGGGGGSGSLAKRDLAVKIINKSRVRDVVALQRVANEIRVLREANDLNVMALFDVIHTEMRLYMVLERGDRDLFQVIMDSAQEDKHGPGRVDEDFAREIMCQLLSGVRYLHGMNVCHRDLKPENVVLVEKPGAPKPIVKIIDFGSCAATNGGLTLHDLCGTPGFVPPEMIMEDAYDGFMGDVWSIGCIALEMTMGHQSFVDLWLPSYQNELVGSRQEFAITIANAVPHMSNQMKKRVKNKLCSAASQDAIFHALIVNPRKRISVDDFYSHRWVGGKTKEISMGSPTSSASEKVNEDQAVKVEGKEEVSVVGLGISAIEFGQEKLMRRSQSVNDLKSANLAKQLAKPPTPRRLPPLDTDVSESKNNNDSKNDNNNNNNNNTTNKSKSSKRNNLRVDAIMANKYDNKRSGVNGGVERIQEPLSPAISDVKKILNKGDEIIYKMNQDKKRNEGKASEDEQGGRKTPEGNRSPSDPTVSSPLARSKGDK